MFRWTAFMGLAGVEKNTTAPLFYSIIASILINLRDLAQKFINRLLLYQLVL